MNKTLMHRLYEHNRWMLPFSLLLIALMFGKNYLVNYMIFVILSYFIMRQVYRFIPLRFDDSEDQVIDVAYQLLPVLKKELQLYHVINALLWSIVTMFFLVAQVVTSPIKVEYSIMMWVWGGIVSLFPLLIACFERYIEKLGRGFLSVFAYLGYLLFLLMQMGTPIQNERMYTVIGIFLVLIILFMICNGVSKKIMPFIEKQDVNLFCKHRMYLIYSLTKYRFHNKKQWKNYMGVLIMGQFWIIKGDLVWTILVILIANMHILSKNLSCYFNDETLVSIVPISKKEKWITCHIHTFLKVIVVNAGISCLAMIGHKVTLLVMMKYWMMIVAITLLIYFIIVYFEKKSD